MDEIVLQVNASTGLVDMQIIEVGAALVHSASFASALRDAAEHAGRGSATSATSPKPASIRLPSLPRQVAKPNQAHKKRCMLGLLRDAVRHHSAELAALLGQRQLRFIVETEDFGVVLRAERWKLPAFAMCTGGCRRELAGAWVFSLLARILLNRIPCTSGGGIHPPRHS